MDIDSAKEKIEFFKKHWVLLTVLSAFVSIALVLSMNSKHTPKGIQKEYIDSSYIDCSTIDCGGFYANNLNYLSK